MSIKLLNNLPIEDLTKENDYLGIIEKGDLIKLFLENNQDQFSEIKMFALYGEWGSGKSTLMKYLQKELKPNFNILFFDTWEFETDNNLALSLLELLILESTAAGEEIAGDLIKVAEKLLKGFTKSVRISFPGFSIDSKALTEELESEKEKTFVQLRKEFKTEFQRWEDKAKAQNKKEYNIIFIDDLDRCEPENVLNLLSAIKLFFTYGKRTIFVCGIDKKAVREAVETRYKSIVKSNEYLEKIFDISFEMPEYDDVQKLINIIFDTLEIKLGAFEGKLNNKIGEFFNHLNFTNPRRVKKILNKYLILSSFKEIEKINSSIPNIYIPGKEDGNFLETILTLYFLILNEFYKEKLNGFYNIQLKKINFRKAVENKYRNVEGSGASSSNVNIVCASLDDNSFWVGLDSFSKISTGNNQQRKVIISKFMKIFSPHTPEYLTNSAFVEREYFNKSFQVEIKSVDYFLADYLLMNVNDLVLNDKTISNFNIRDFKTMLKKYL